MRRRCEHSRQRLDAARRRPFLQRPEAMYDPLARRLAGLADRLHAAAGRQLKASRQRLAARGRQLDSVGPANVLQRGYSYTLGPRGAVLRSATAVHTGDRITTVLADGEVASRVEDGSAPAPAQRRRRRDDADQLGLFAPQ